MVVAIEGIPAAGKTETARRLGPMLGAEVVTETTAEHPFLAQVYDDSARDDITVELGFLIVHANPYRLIDSTALTVCDYSPRKDLLFADEMLQGSELALFHQVYSELYRGYEPPDLVVFLDVPPAICLERAERRRMADPGRSFEAGLTVDRLAALKRRYMRSRDTLGATTLTYTPEENETAESVASAVADLVKESVGPSAKRG